MRRISCLSGTLSRRVKNNSGNPHLMRIGCAMEDQKPEWITVTEATRLFGIGRSSLYELMAEGRIKSASIRKRGSLRGRRLISFDSLAGFVEEHVIS